MKAPWMFLLPVLLFVCGPAAGQIADKDNICVALQVPEGKYSETYVQGVDDVIKPLGNTVLADITGRKVLGCYVSLRSPEDLPDGVAQRGAINIKFEFWQPDGDDIVYLYNNHTPFQRTCAARKFDTYQAFHEYGLIENCLRYGFHNLPGDFATFEREERRKAFLFPDRSLWEWFRGLDAKMPARRASIILNYAVPADFSVIRVPFYFFTSREMTAARIVVDDLLETRINQQIPRLRVLIK